MTSLAFRFDIDTHKCIKNGVPELLELARKHGVTFSFFLNAGKSIDLFDSLFSKFSHSVFCEEHAPMLSALEKLGKKDYLYAALINPSLKKYKKEILQIVVDDHELCLHGGKNHGTWMKKASSWTKERYNREIEYGLAAIKKIIPDYKPCGFASPGYVHNENLYESLCEHDFLYTADCTGKGAVVNKASSKNFFNLRTTILGMPGNIAYFETCEASSMNDDEIINDVLSQLKKDELNIIYDHPYFVGCKKIGLLDSLLKKLKEESVSIVQMKDLIDLEKDK